ncbi:alpha-amylase [Candidatus Bathyarchaeota archaeon]|nr:alpha-amylase [Candidatus Bathyarchaeota archaeon]
MTDIVFVFEVHQPHRLRKNYFWENNLFKRLTKEKLFDYYFNREMNRDVFERACRKCYFPSNNILLEIIDDHKRDKKQVKFSFSISGVFLEQCEMFNKDLLESFKQLVETGCVELLGQTYYHSLASLYPNKAEFIEQVEMHRQVTRDLLGYTPKVFENTELIYNNTIAKIAEDLKFIGIFTEGVERILHGRSPNYLYSPRGCSEIKVLLRNYQLTDDIGFRFSARDWSEWPLTADKYASWLAATPGQCINIFPDYETFGEHHWPETGIHEFLKKLPEEILKWQHLSMATPSEAVEKYSPIGEIDVPEHSGTVSWADLERNISCWLGNPYQWAYYTSVMRLETFVKESACSDFLRIWRYFQISDHLYYMYMGGGAPGEVHAYFSSFDSPAEAYITAQAAILDFENRVRIATLAANEPFLFYLDEGEENYTGVMVWTLRGLIKALEKVDVKSLEFHMRRGDFEKWIKNSLRDEKLAAKIKEIKTSNLNGEKLRKALLNAARRRFTQLFKKAKEATQYF